MHKNTLTVNRSSRRCPAIYYWNEAEQLLEELLNQTISGNMVSVELKHFLRYMLLNKRPFDDVWQHDIRPEVGTRERIDLAIVMDRFCRLH
ncbi:MAG: hypothetical protein LBV33_08195 [Lachnospiraceae bacterium]|nr:hypothetical protein [Lachnospiraceae bacterium]